MRSLATARSIAKRWRPWRKSKADKEVRLVEHLENECGSRCGHKKSIRSESRVGDVIFLAQARGAVDAICKLVSRDAQRRTKVEAPDNAPIPPDAPRKDDLHNMDDAGHRAVETRSTAEMRMSNGPLPNGHGAKKS